MFVPQYGISIQVNAISDTLCRTPHATARPDLGYCYSVNREQHSSVGALKLPESNEHDIPQVNPRRKTEVGSSLSAVRL